jgi:pilus assembly protein CpaE
MLRVVVVQNALGPIESLLPVFARAGFAPPTLRDSLAQVVDEVRKGDVALVALPVQLLQGHGRFELETMLHNAPSLATIGTAPFADADAILVGMRAGIGEFLVSPPSPTDLEQALMHLRRKWGESTMRGSLTAVYAPKGGVGATTIAVNTSYALAARRPDARVVLVDLNVGLGDIDTHLNLPNAYNIGDLVRRLDQADPDLLHAIVTPCGDGLFALPACDDLEVADLVQAEAVNRVLSVCRSTFQHTVVDCEHAFGPRTVAALDAAEQIILVLQSNVAAIRAAKRSLALFRQLDYPTEKIKVVLNREGPGDVLSHTDISKSLGVPISLRLPNAFQLANEAQTRGIPILKANPTATLSQAFNILATRVVGEVAVVEPSETPEVKRRSLFGLRRK